MAGMFAALLVAPRVMARMGSKLTVTPGLAASLIAYLPPGAFSWRTRIVPGVPTGQGIGMRWIANKPGSTASCPPTRAAGPPAFTRR
ncbi:hypothetical protein [Paraburkholderia sp. LEh10]|jgi:hypothetical protein|uniref:hypothetical protein n=1 Tax=Paraburkholderia sp. LEh10 TaxID=2821353 RepID=UPI001FD79028|nr:hypothetical protein [Paraburkholderia sp. LEh10]